MNILIQGGMLRHGLERAGHRVFSIPDGVEHDILRCVEECGVPIDLVLVELFGLTSIPRNLHRCPASVAAWCVDSSINEFWLSEICRVCDDVFVDQAGTAEAFRKKGIRCQWLPLFAQESWFRTPKGKEHGLVFVGNVSQFRPKRANLLALLQGRFPLLIRKGLSAAATQDLFAASRIVLNENLFDGLTLRVFQGLASGSLVLTERGYGMDRLFHDGEHLVTYGPDNVLERVASLLDDPGRCAAIAERGREICLERHTETVRAAELVAAVKAGEARSPRLAPDMRLLHETRGRYRLVLRYGGFFQNIVRTFSALAEGDGESAALARFELGGIAARAGNAARAHAMYAAASEAGLAVLPHLAAALLHLHAGDVSPARRETACALADAAQGHAGEIAPLIRMLPNADHPGLLHVIARAHDILGRAADVGFQKNFRDAVPETALEVARMAWERERAPRHMDLMLDAAGRHGVAGALLPDCLDGIAAGALTDRQMARTAELARECYDFDVARTITSALRAAGRGEDA